MQKHTLQNKKTTSGISTIKENESSKLIRTIIKKFVFRFKLSTNEIIKNNQFEKENIYELNDPASHLNEEAYVLYIKKIFKIIREKKN